jgi:hypothetical protein
MNVRFATKISPGLCHVHLLSAGESASSFLRGFSLPPYFFVMTSGR